MKTSEIIVKLKDWLSTVAVGSPRRPIIYTRSNYWRDMLGEADFDLIKPYAIWLGTQRILPAGMTHMPQIPGGCRTYQKAHPIHLASLAIRMPQVIFGSSYRRRK